MNLLQFYVFFLILLFWGASSVLFAAVPYSQTPNLPAYLEFKTANQPAGFNEYNLWWIEEDRLRRTYPLITPDFSAYTYGEVIYLPDTRQVFSTLYWVPLPNLPQVQSSVDIKKKVPAFNPEDPRYYTSWFDETAILQRRTPILKVNQGEQKGFSFETLTPLDWNANSQRLLFKRRAGLLYTGLRASDVLVWDKASGTISLYQELLRALEYHFITLKKGDEIAPRLSRMSWDIEPLGWKAGSNSQFYWRAWAYTLYPEKKRYFLGLWLYDVELKETRSVSLSDSNMPSDIAFNGFIPHLKPEKYGTPYQKKLEGNEAPKMKRPKQRQVFF
jgi:hypothetical protein